MPQTKVTVRILSGDIKCGMLRAGSKTSEMLDMLQWDARLREPKERGGFVGLSPVAGRHCNCKDRLHE